MKQSELQNKGVITSLAVQQQIAAGNAEALIGANRVAHLEGELAESKVCVIGVVMLGIFVSYGECIQFLHALKKKIKQSKTSKLFEIC